MKFDYARITNNTNMLIVVFVSFVQLGISG